MNRILIINGKIIGGQTGGDDIPELMETRLDVLKQNALNAGFKEDEIEVKWVTDAEWAVIQTDTMKPTPEQIAATCNPDYFHYGPRKYTDERERHEGGSC